jgi:hypothetical protein
MMIAESQLRKIVRQEILGSTKKRIKESVYDYDGGGVDDSYEDEEIETSGVDEILEALKSDPDAIDAASAGDNEMMYQALKRVSNELGISLGMDQIGELAARAMSEV